MALKFVSALVCFALLCSCSTTPDTPSTASQKPATEDLRSFSSNAIELRTGDKVTIDFSVHGSIGETIEYEVQNKKVVKLADESFEYSDPSKKDLDGGDRGTKIYIFEAISEGTTTLKFIEEFRGKIENETIYTLDVK